VADALFGQLADEFATEFAFLGLLGELIIEISRYDWGDSMGREEVLGPRVEDISLREGVTLDELVRQMKAGGGS